MRGSGATNHRLVSGIKQPEKCRLPDLIANPKAACTAQRGGIGYAMLPCCIKKQKAACTSVFQSAGCFFAAWRQHRYAPNPKHAGCFLIFQKQPARFILPNPQYPAHCFPRPSPISLPDTARGNFSVACSVRPLCAHCESACAGCPHPRGDIAPQTP